MTRGFEGAVDLRGWEAVKLRRGMLLLAFVALTGCGYRLSGQAGTVPTTLRQLSVPMFTNRTAIPALERVFTAAVRERLLRDGRVTLVTDAGSAAVLRGEVMRYQLEVLATSRDDRALEYRANVEIHVRLEDGQHRTIIVEQPVTATAEYIISGGLVPTDIARERALQEVARVAGESVVSLLLDRF